MKQTLYSWRKHLVGLLLLALAVGPLSLSAQSLAEQIGSLRSQLVTLNDIINNTPGLTPSEISQLNGQISNVNTAITNLEASALDVTTMEVIIDVPTNYAEAQFLNASGSVMYLDFFFATTPTTTQDWFDAIVDRTALTLGYSSTTIPSPSSLAANIVQVPAFNGPSVFFPQATTTAPVATTSFTPTAPVATVVTPYRNNVEKVELFGNAKDYRVTAHVHYGPETTATTTLAAASSTFRFDLSASTTAAEHDYMSRLPELESLALQELVRQTGYSQNFLDSISVTSFSTFEDSFDVQYRALPRAQGEGLVNLFGSYSIIDDIDFVVGEGTFRMIMSSDQNEQLVLSLREENSSGDDRNGGWDQGNGDWDYGLTYSIHGVVLDSDTDSNYDRPGVTNYFLVNDLLEGIGAFMGTPSTTTMTEDEVFVNELTAFMMAHTVYYETDDYWSSFSRRDTALNGAAACHDARTEEIMERVATFYLDQGLQYASTTAAITELRSPINYVDHDGGFGWFSSFWSSQCRSVNNSFFPTQP